MAGMVQISEDEASISEHSFKSTWTLWTHLPTDDWGLDSYKKITQFKTIENSLQLLENLPENIIKNSMLFLMREDINPLWEDENNKNGGCFSYKVNNKIVNDLWKKMAYLLMGESLATPEVSKYINGITISPKKNFCIIKIWLSNCNYNNPDVITQIDYLNKNGCLFKKHILD